MSEPKQPPTVADLHRLALSNSMVYTHLVAWRAGGFESFEQCLVSLCVELAKENGRHYREVLKAYLHQPPHTFTVPLRAAKDGCEAGDLIAGGPAGETVNLTAARRGKLVAQPDAFDEIALRVLPDAASAALGTRLMQQRVDKIVRDLLDPQPVREWTGEGMSIDLPADFDPPAIVEEK